MKYFKKILFFLILSFACVLSKFEKELELVDTSSELTSRLENKVIINVFIHGTIASGAVLFSPIRFFRGNLDDISWGVQLTKFARSNEFYRRKMLVPDFMGLSKIDFCNFNSHLQFLAQSYDNIFKNIFPDIKTSYYSFGWNGFLSQQQRVLAAKKLYSELSDLYYDLAAKGLNPEFNLICHSHGGNLGLLLGKLHSHMLGKPIVTEKEVQKLNWIGRLEYYSELILKKVLRKKIKPIRGLNLESLFENFKCQALPEKSVTLSMFGTPIQSETEILATSSLFENVFNFYSLGDWVQSSDFISTTRRRAHQIFKQDILNQAPGVVQIQVYYKVKGDKIIKPGHLELYCPTFSQVRFPAILVLPGFIYKLKKIVDKKKYEQPNLQNLSMCLVSEENSGVAKNFLSFRIHDKADFHTFSNFNLETNEHFQLRNKIRCFEKKELSKLKFKLGQRLFFGFVCRGLFFDPRTPLVDLITT